MLKSGGYANKVAIVNLTERKIEYEELDDDTVMKYICCRGLGDWYFYRMGYNVEPFSPENPVIFMTGPLNGGIATMANRLPVVTRSPLTETIINSHVGGYMAPAMKWAGFDGVIVIGQSDKPVYLPLKVWISYDRGRHIIMGKRNY